MTHREIEWKILEVFQECYVESFPVNIFELIEHYNYECVEYTEQSSIKQQACLSYSEDSFILKDKVYYNDAKPFRRRRFSLAHELGHIILGHKYPHTPQMEQEANYFSSRLLAPRMAIHYSCSRNAFDVSDRFLLTLEAANYAFKDYKHWLDNIKHNKMTILDKTMYDHFYNPFEKYFVWNVKYCRDCKSVIYNNPEAVYCEHHQPLLMKAAHCM